MIIRTLPYSMQEIMQILSIRANVESISIDEPALQYLAQLGAKSSLRYAVQLLTPAKILSKTYGKPSITKEDIEEASSLFFDAKTSAKMLKENESKFLK